VVTVDEIDVSMAWRSEQNRVARGVAGGCVSGSIVLPEIGFDFDDASGEIEILIAPDQDFSEKIPGYPPRRMGEKGPGQGMDEIWLGIRGD
jgi:hypothetical protein